MEISQKVPVGEADDNFEVDDMIDYEDDKFDMADDTVEANAVNNEDDNEDEGGREKGKGWENQGNGGEPSRRSTLDGRERETRRRREGRTILRRGYERKRVSALWERRCGSAGACA